MRKLLIIAILLYFVVVAVDTILIITSIYNNSLATFDIIIFTIQTIVLTPLYIYGAKKSADYLSNAFKTVNLHKDLLLPGVLIGACIAIAISYMFIFYFILQITPNDFLDTIVEQPTAMNFVEPTFAEYWWSAKFFLIMMGFLSMLILPVLAMSFVRNRLSLATIFMVKDADEGKDPSLLGSYKKVSKKLTQDLTLLRGLLTSTSIRSTGGRLAKIEHILRPLFILTPIIAVYKNQSIKDSFFEAMEYYKNKFYESIFGGMFFGNLRYLVYTLITIVIISMLTSTPLFSRGGLAEQTELISIALYDLTILITILSIYYIYSGTLESLETVYYIRLFQKQEGLPVKEVDDELAKKIHAVIEANKEKIKEKL